MGTLELLRTVLTAHSRIGLKVFCFVRENLVPLPGMFVCGGLMLLVWLTIANEVVLCNYKKNLKSKL